MWLSMKKIKGSKKLLSDYSKISGNKVNIQKSIAFLHSSNKQLEFVIKNCHLHLHQKNVLRYKWKKNMYKIYMKKATKLMKGNKEDLNKWENILYTWIGRLNIVKMWILPNLICRFSVIPVKIPANYFVDVDKQNSSYLDECYYQCLLNEWLLENRTVYAILRYYSKVVNILDIWKSWKKLIPYICLLDSTFVLILLYFLSRLVC